MGRFNKIIGPSLVVIPRREFISCKGCIYYSHHMVRSGMHPLYKDECIYHLSHPDELSHPVILYSSMEEVHTPDECPLIKMFKRNQKINSII